MAGTHSGHGMAGTGSQQHGGARRAWDVQRRRQLTEALHDAREERSLVHNQHNPTD